MCWVCKAYGDGGLWFLNPKNHSRQLYKRRKPGEGFKEFGSDPEMQSGRRLREIIALKFHDPPKFAELVKQTNELRERGGFQIGQVIPLKECYEVCDIAYPVVGMSCICRIHSRAREERSGDEYSCTGLGVGMFKWERWPERYKGGVEFFSPDQAKEWLTKWDKKGMVHILMTFGGSYVGGICNCDYPDCGAIRHRLDYGLEIGCLKSHYVAKVDYDKCNGCGVCAQRCQFGALKFEVTTSKANVDMMRCFGCGLCETGCPRSAITLLDRESLPALREVW